MVIVFFSCVSRIIFTSVANFIRSLWNIMYSGH
jgi:hypothetical protein